MKSRSDLLSRREFARTALAWAALSTTGLSFGSRVRAAQPVSLDPVNPDVWYGITGSMWGEWAPGKPMHLSSDLRRMVTDTARYGLQGLETYSMQLGQYLRHPVEIKKMCTRAGITFIDSGDLPPAAPPPPAPGPTANGNGNASPFGGGPYPWLGEQGNTQLIQDMVHFARNFLAPLGCNHWKTNMGGRPPDGPSEDQLKRLADTLNEIGRKTLDYGVRLAPHPHIWGPMEREHEFRTVMEWTDPRYVWLTLDTGHNVLGGMDPVQIVAEYLPRIAEFHLKDTYAKYRGNKHTPPPETYINGDIWGTLGAYQGVDFPAIFKIIRDRKWKGWAVVDVDAPRPGHGTIDESLAANVNYLRNVLHVHLAPPPSLAE